MKQYPSHVDNLIALRRIEGQVRGIQRMIKSREYCVDILNQIHAVIMALARVEDKILRKHFQGCVTNAVKSKSAKDTQMKLDEILQLIHQFRKV